MRQLSIALIALSVLTTSYAYADAQNFQGLRVGGNLNMTGASTKMNVPSLSATGSFGDTTLSGGVKIGYSHKVSQKAYIGLGATYSNTKINAGSLTTSVGSETLTGKNIWTAFLEPGIAISENTLFYGKAGYAGMRGGAEGDTTNYSFQGYVYGAGLRTMVDQNLYLEVEAVQLKFNSKTIGSATYEIKATQANVGAGYKF